MITNHPDYFSTFVPFGGYFRHIHNEEKMQTVANSSTKIIIYHSTRDDVYDRAVHIYNTLKQNGAQIVMYEFSGNCGHHNINVGEQMTLDGFIGIVYKLPAKWTIKKIVNLGVKD